MDCWLGWCLGMPLKPPWPGPRRAGPRSILWVKDWYRPDVLAESDLKLLSAVDFAREDCVGLASLSPQLLLLLLLPPSRDVPDALTP